MTDIFQNQDTSVRCEVCGRPAAYRVEFFEGIAASGPAVDLCPVCLRQDESVTARRAASARIRVTSLLTGRHTMGPPDRLERLLQQLEPSGRFRTITSAVRLTTSRGNDLGLVCSRCRQPVTKETPAAVAWTVRPDGTSHSVRVFHADCLPEDAVFGVNCVELEHIGQMDRSKFGTAAKEILDQIQRMIEK